VPIDSVAARPSPVLRKLPSCYGLETLVSYRSPVDPRAPEAPGPASGVRIQPQWPRGRAWTGWDGSASGLSVLLGQPEQVLV